MRPSIFRSGTVLIGALAALAACSGQSSVVPSQQSAAQNLENPTGVSQLNPMAAPNCYTSKYQKYWIFKGPCHIGTITKAGAVIKLPAYKKGTQSVTLAVGLPKNTATAPVPYIVTEAYDKGDISPYKGKAFPPFNAGKGVVLYVQGANDSTQTVKVEGNIILNLTSSTGYPGKRCSLALLDGTKWTTTPAYAEPKGNKLLLQISGSALNGQLGGLKPGPLFVSVYC